MKQQNDKRKIALYVPLLAGGGAERVFVNLANEFAERGFAVDLVLNQKEGPYLKNVKSKVNIVELGARKTLLCALPLAVYLKRSRPEALLSALDHANIVVMLIKYLFKPSTKVVITHHQFFSMKLNNYKSIKRHIIRFLTFILYRNADMQIAVSRGVADDIAKAINVKKEAIKVIYNPVIDKEDAFRKKDAVTHPWLQEIGEGEKIILGAGRLTQQKDFPTLIKAFSSLTDKTKKAKLIILGEGEELGRLKALVEKLNIQSRVAFPGFVDNPYAYISRADVFVLSSAFEGFANVILEALFCGTPVVSTDCPSGPAEILQDGRYGKLVPVGDVEAMTHAIVDILDNPPSPEFLQKRAEDFDVAKIVDRYLETLFQD